MRRAAPWLVLALVLAGRPFLIAGRVYDPDEFEHLHAAIAAAQGALPYRDFFEHHGPATYWMLAPFVRAVGPTVDLLTIHRILSFAGCLAILAATAWCCRQTAGRRATPWAL